MSEAIGFSRSKGQRVLLVLPSESGLGLPNREFPNWEIALEFLLAYEPAAAEVWYHGGDGWHHFKTLRRIGSEEIAAPTGYRWER
jgi:hypothetical protein